LRQRHAVLQQPLKLAGGSPQQAVILSNGANVLRGLRRQARFKPFAKHVVGLLDAEELQ
jgi:hypothetical protein